MDTYAIHPLRLGTIRRKKSNMVYRCGSDAQVDFPLIAFYLKGKDHNILVDTGGSTPDGVKWMPYFRKPEEELDRALFAIGVTPRDVDAVVFTHLHWDHAGNNRLFPSAQLYVQRLEYDYIASPGDKPGFEKDLVLESTYELLDGDSEVFSGLSVVLTPGHTTGGQCIIVNTDDGRKVIGGDLIPTYENLENNPMIPNGGHYDFETIMASMKKILSLGYCIIPGHDVRVFDENNGNCLEIRKNTI